MVAVQFLELSIKLSLECLALGCLTPCCCLSGAAFLLLSQFLGGGTLFFFRLERCDGGVLGKVIFAVVKTLPKAFGLLPGKDAHPSFFQFGIDQVILFRIIAACIRTGHIYSLVACAITGSCFADPGLLFRRVVPGGDDFFCGKGSAGFPVVDTGGSGFFFHLFTFAGKNKVHQFGKFGHLTDEA